jgi:hypothetical protein
MYHFSKSYFRWTFTLFLINDALPLVLWVVFYPQLLRDIIEHIKRRNNMDLCPVDDVKKGGGAG